MKKITKMLLVALCIPLLLTGCKKVPKLQDGKEVVVELEGKQFTAEELYDAMKETYGTSALVNMVDKYIVSKELTDDMKKEAKEAASQELEIYKAYYSSSWDYFLSQNGFNTDAELLEAIVKSQEQSIVLKNYVKSTITSEEIQKYYDESIEGEITARHILIIPEVTDKMTDDEKSKAENDALNKAKELISQLKSSTDLENDFAEKAKTESKDTGTASLGGLLENFTADGLDESFYQGALKLEVGKMTTEPVKSQFGYHIIYKVSQKEKPALDTVKDTVIDKLTTQNLSATNASYIYFAGLREKYGLNIHDDIIKNNYDLSMKNMEKESE